MRMKRGMEPQPMALSKLFKFLIINEIDLALAFFAEIF
jgi:hypothetical protein